MTSDRLLRPILPLLLAGLALLVFVGVATAAPVELPEAPAEPPDVVCNPLVAGVIAQITTPTLKYELEGLTGERPVTVGGMSYTIESRNILEGDAAVMATRYAYEWLSETGLDVSYHTYTWGDYEGRNVVAEKAGLIDPDMVYLITAHLDDMPPGPRAPGADDNASGCVAVMLAARLLAPRDLAYTVRFVLFTGEEYGLLGSDAYAADCSARGEDIRGVINLDMIGYNTGEPVYEVFARSGGAMGAAESRQLAAIFAEVASLYDLALIPQEIVIDDYPLVGGSDQWSFLVQGYPAILVSEGFTSDDFNPHYHTVSDTLSVMDLGYCADLTRASVAALAHMGYILPNDDVGQLSGMIYDSHTEQPVPGATVAAFWPAYHYTFTARADRDGVYALSVPAGEYTLTVRSASLSYVSVVVTDVAVSPDASVAQDIALGDREEAAPEPAPEPIVDLGDPARVLALLAQVWHAVFSCLDW
ncbi:MAG: M28 family peptidase [Anaerolineae bacterium]|nr:M28 family peptidase [Anaerolineae bacterium]